MTNYIFDFDGTLVDSYPSIIDKLLRVNKILGIEYSYDFIFSTVIKTSSSEYIDYVCKENKIAVEKFNEVYHSVEANLDLIEIMTEVKGTLKALHEQGYNLFIYTHRGPSCLGILKRLGIDIYFKDVIDSSKGLKRKPSGEGIRYVVDKWKLSRDETCYVGDRELDLLAANDAGVKSVFFATSGIDSKTDPTFKITHFSELINIR